MVSVAETAHVMRQVGAGKANAGEPLMKCRKRIDDIETRVQLLPWDEPGGCLLIGQVVSGTKVARARFRRQCGTWELLVPICQVACWSHRREGDPQAAETARGSVPMRGRRTDRLVVAGKPGNAGGAKGAGCPGWLGGQPAWLGGAG